jgi:hypothetical protein
MGCILLLHVRLFLFGLSSHEDDAVNGGEKDEEEEMSKWLRLYRTSENKTKMFHGMKINELIADCDCLSTLRRWKLVCLDFENDIDERIKQLDPDDKGSSSSSSSDNSNGAAEGGQVEEKEEDGGGMDVVVNNKSRYSFLTWQCSILCVIMLHSVNGGVIR